MNRNLLLLLYLCCGFAIPQRLLGQGLWQEQGYCWTLYTDVDRYQGYVDWESKNNDPDHYLNYNQKVLKEKRASLQECERKEFGSEPRVTSMDGGEVLIFPNGPCFLPREIAKDTDVKVGLTIKAVKADFNLGTDVTTKYERVTKEDATIHQMTVALFLSCLDAVGGRISGPDYRISKQVYDRILEESHFKRVAQKADATGGYVAVGCEETKPGEAVVHFNGKAPQITASSAAWVNTDNLKGQDQVVTEIRDANNVLVGVKATGHINGRDRDTFPFNVKNCPGGGHGTLAVHVEWTELVPTDQ
jgi:hypothetical protein